MKRLSAGLFTAIAAFGFACTLAAEPMGTIDEKTGNIVVKADNFQCTFFKNHMFPVWFKRADGTDYPRVLYFGDRVYETTGKKRLFYLYRDLWAERKIIVNREDVFMIEMSGVFTNHFGDTVAPDGLKAIYRYELRKNENGIRIRGRVVRGDTKNPTVYHFFALNPVFLGQPAPNIFIGDKEQPTPQIDGSKEIKPPSTDVALIAPTFRIGLRTPKAYSVIQICTKPDNTTSFLGFRVLNWKGSYLTFEGEFYFEPLENK